jgi:hypothetical protein
VKRLWFVALIALLPLVIASPVYAASPSRGLAITPLRQYLTVDGGSQKTSTLTVSNLTSKTLAVKLYDQEFSVDNYSYNYRFDAPIPNLVTLSQDTVSLKPGASQKITYTITAPKNTRPGGQYYTIFASSQLEDNVTVQAATLLYVTIDGKLTTSNELRSSSIQHVVFGNTISYHFDTLDTGNVHYFIYVDGQLHGVTARAADSPVAHLLLPNAIRSVSGSITAPILPGIYKATYGYKTDSGQQITRSGYVLYIPPWSITLFLAIILVLWTTLTTLHKRRKSQKLKLENGS